MTTTPPSLHQLRLRELAVYLREAERALADWDFYSDQHSDSDGWPIDDVAYGLRQRRRDTDTWRAFRPLLYDGHNLLDGAQAQLDTIPADERTSGWEHALTTLRDSLGKMRALQSEWCEIRETLPENARPGTEAYDEPLAERNAEAWHYLDTWAIHGQMLIDIAAAAAAAAAGKATPSPPRPTAAPSLESPTAPRKPPRRGR